MNFSKVIEIDIWSSFGCFSKPFSTTGGILSYLIPPKTSIVGMIGAILGYEFDNHKNGKYVIEELHDIKISVQPLFDLKSKRVTFNKISGTIDNMNIMNINQDILINPYYKIFISFPNHLVDKEEMFIDRISKHETIFDLYMGRNEFPLSYNLCSIFDYESIILKKENLDDFFSNDNVKIFGSLNRKFIDRTELISTISDNWDDDELIFQFNRSYEKKLKSFYEYIIKEYPIRRKNFTDFTYSDISFYSEYNFKECYFSRFTFKDKFMNIASLELIKIGEDEWISMI